MCSSLELLFFPGSTKDAEGQEAFQDQPSPRNTIDQKRFWVGTFLDTKINQPSYFNVFVTAFNCNLMSCPSCQFVF